MKRSSTSLLVVSAVLFSAMGVSAQTMRTADSRPERPYQGLYAGGTDQSQQVVSVNGSVGAGYDTSSVANQREAGLAADSPTSLASRSSGSTFSMLSGGVSYSVSLDRLSGGASLSSSARFYPQSQTSLLTSHGLASGFTVDVSKRTKLTGGASLTYQPVSSFLPFPVAFEPAEGQILAPDQVFGTGRHSYYTNAASAGISRQLSQRSSISVSYDRSAIEPGGIAGWTRQTGSILFNRGLTRRLGMRIGYGYSDVAYDDNARNYGYHNLDTGLDYGRDFSLTRRTKFSFATGGAAVTQGEGTRYDVTGNATLSREIGRTWATAVSFRRAVNFVDSLRGPVFSSGVTVGLNGLITRRLSFSSGAGATIGNVGVGPLGGNNNGFDAWTGFASLNSAITRHLAIGVHYTYYRYGFDSSAGLTNDLLSLVNRHSLVVSLNAWAPVLQHGRRTNAPR